MNDFPKKSFPTCLNPGRNERNTFSGFGRHGNVDSFHGCTKKIDCQYVLYGFHKRNQRLSANVPTLPLFTTPESGVRPFEDVIRDSLVQQERKVLETIRKIKNYKKCKYNYSKEIAEVGRWLDRMKVGSYVDPRITKRIQRSRMWKLAEMYAEIKDIPPLSRVNTNYTGGSVDCLQGENTSDTEGYVISSCGEGLRNIKISEFCVDRRGLVAADCKAEYAFMEGVKELQCGTNKNKDCVLVRGKSKCEFLRANHDSDGTDGTVLHHIDKYDFTEEETPTSICISPYIVGENLIASSRGNVYLLKPDVREERVLSEIDHRFYSHCQWRQAVYGAHPRHILLADRTALQAFDLRRNSSDGLDLFALPSRHLNKHERIQVIEPYSGSHHNVILATDYSLFLLDERFPGHPLLTWYHALTLPPTYLTCLTSVGGADLDLVTISSQSPVDVCCYSVDIRSSQTPVALDSPFQISCLDDMTHWPEICNGPSRIVAKDRFCTSLAGVTMTNTTNGFCVFQLDSYGDVFYQTYKVRSSDCDRTYCSGPESHDLNIEDCIPIAQEWLNKVVESVRVRQEAERFERSAGIPKVKVTMKELIPSLPAHVRCDLCTVTSDPGYHGISGDDDLFVDVQPDDKDLCYSCFQQLMEGKIIKDAEKELPAQSYADPDITEITTVTASVDDLQQTDSISQILLKLWKEDFDFHELLLKRDEEIQMRKKKMDPKCNTAEFTTRVNQKVSTVKHQIVRQIVALEQPQSDLPNSSLCDGAGSEMVNLTFSNQDTYSELGGQIIPSSRIVTSDLTESNVPDTVTLPLTQSLTLPSKRRRRHSSSSSNISRLSSLSVLSRQSDGFRSTPTKLLSYWQAEINNKERECKSDSESDLFGNTGDNDTFSLFTASQENFLSSINSGTLTKETESSPRKKKKFVSGF